ncbi:HAD family hydrolase [Anaerosporobacter sp.]|uniref:HAD family hydrolase n=1 Tax=Anaerosporobacter sp. TaxID=1872529 RepID=UPI00286F4796|nr:HAD family hydrolase [Anaerosporobacter sp.]
MNNMLLLFDLDGTLLKSNKTKSTYTYEILDQCRQAGFIIGVSTARSEKNSLEFISKLNPEIIISSGGALVRLKNDYVYRAEFSIEETNAFIELARTVCGENCEITVDTVNEHYWNYKIDPKKLDASWGDTIYSDFNDFSENALKICVEISNTVIAKALQEKCKEYSCVKFSDGDWYKFSKKTATKENAIVTLCSEINISVNDMIAFGDDYSDIEMLKCCGIGVAMGNAIEEVKAIADCVIGTNDEEGIAKYLEGLLTKKNSML